MSATDSMSLHSRSRTVVVALNVITTAFVAHFLTEFLHEATHGITSLFTGQRWDTLYLQASNSSWLDDGPHLWGDVATLVSAPLFNIVCALVCIYLFPYLSERPSTRLFVLLFGGYSLFAGFGYFVVDPLLAQPEAWQHGDIARVILLFGGNWGLRILLFAFGSVGTIYGYFWFGKAALHFTDGDMAIRSNRIHIGLLILILPYIFINLVLTALGFGHPLGSAGVIITAVRAWFGFIGFFWAFMIRFVWMRYQGPYTRETPIPTKLNIPFLVASVIAIILSLLLLPGIKLGWTLYGR